VGIGNRRVGNDGKGELESITDISLSGRISV